MHVSPRILLRSAILSDSANTSKDQPTATKATCCLWLPIVALVFLRLCVGWHFFSEGIKKFEYDQSRGEWKLVFSAEGFLSGAKGPFAHLYHNQTPSVHNWREAIANPKQLSPEASARLNAWVGSYVKRRQAELQQGKVNPPQYVEFSPADAWGKNILGDWKTLKEKFVADKDLSDEQRKSADEIYKKYELHLADFLAEESLAIESYQHELWRLAQAESQPGSGEVPFAIARVNELDTRLASTPRVWVAAVKSMDEGFADELFGVLTPEQRESAVGRRAVKVLENSETRHLERMNWTVAFVVTGVGVCLLLGLFTRTAAVVGALFLLSVMLSQPPWVAGAMSPVPYYYQLVEFAALLFLAAVGAGRWAGLDYIIQGLWHKRHRVQGA
jgi:uncharacterized membrane protein YphA (DoxX/SURF4 family)